MNNIFLRYIGKISTDSNKKLAKIKVKFKVDNVSGKVKATDLMLQENGILTGYTIHANEMLIVKNTEPKFYNALIRGQGTAVIVNNDGEMTSGLDFNVAFKNGSTGAFKLETLYKTRNFEFLDTVGSGGAVKVDSFNYKVNKEGEENKNYKGSFMQIPSGFGIYNADMNERDIGRFIFYVKEYDKGGKL